MNLNNINGVYLTDNIGLNYSEPRSGGLASRVEDGQGAVNYYDDCKIAILKLRLDQSL